ncbi:hypothetical protein [Brachybacterium sp. GU-2]|uniref:hypothetical protein n=1 Tax=Brachybacterium sp. GU-2 TaxID=3069708 RepID=UPI00280B9867|nr:hypothetical protein [Brachybacterium sp. GU-2]WME22109.1 hypothetical protein RBL05_11245 [Brachybacterium sp. GU-2]
MTEMTTYQQPAAALDTQMQFAKAVTASGGSILPKAYQGNPGNALIAINLGSSMGLAPAESLYRIDVIQGTPTASAELVASNVRKAGHKLRVKVDEQAQSVTAEIIRADDPDYTYTVTRDMKWAKDMGLAGKDNYRKQPMTMLQWRAITAVARLAASEALYGVGYTSDEIREMPSPQQAQAVTADQFIPAQTQGQDELKAAIDETGEAPSEQQRKKMFAALRDIGLTERDDILEYVSNLTGRTVESSNDLTRAEVSTIIDSLEGDTPNA